MGTPSDAAARGTHSVAAKWTPYLTARGFIPVARSFLRHYQCLGITPGQAMFIIHLVDFKRGSAALYPRYATVGRYMGISPKMVRVHAHRLEKAGLLNRDRKSGPTTQFDLTPLFSQLEAHLQSPSHDETFDDDDII